MAKSVELPNGGDGWLLTDEEYTQLTADSDFLAALDAAGVDNWEGYSAAFRILEGEEEW